MTLPPQLEPLALAEVERWASYFGPPCDADHAKGRVEQIRANLAEALALYETLGPDVEADLRRIEAAEAEWLHSCGPLGPGTLDIARGPKVRWELLAAVAEAMSRLQPS